MKKFWIAKLGFGGSGAARPCPRRCAAAAPPPAAWPAPPPAWPGRERHHRRRRVSAAVHDRLQGRGRDGGRRDRHRRCGRGQARRNDRPGARSAPVAAAAARAGRRPRTGRAGRQRAKAAEADGGDAPHRRAHAGQGAADVAKPEVPVDAGARHPETPVGHRRRAAARPRRTAPGDASTRTPMLTDVPTSRLHRLRRRRRRPPRRFPRCPGTTRPSPAAPPAELTPPPAPPRAPQARRASRRRPRTRPRPSCPPSLRDPLPLP